MPSRSWSAIGRSCWEEYQPGSGADIALCVAASATSSSGRPQSSSWPLHAPAAGAAVDVPPEPTNTLTPATISAAATSEAITVRRRTRAGVPVSRGARSVRGGRGS
jgi:hypothetical protein